VKADGKVEKLETKGREAVEQIASKNYLSGEFCVNHLASADKILLLGVVADTGSDARRFAIVASSEVNRATGKHGKISFKKL